MRHRLAKRSGSLESPINQPRAVNATLVVSPSFLPPPHTFLPFSPQIGTPRAQQPGTVPRGSLPQGRDGLQRWTYITGMYPHSIPLPAYPRAADRRRRIYPRRRCDGEHDVLSCGPEPSFGPVMLGQRAYVTERCFPTRQDLWARARASRKILVRDGGIFRVVRFSFPRPHPLPLPPSLPPLPTPRTTRDA